MHALLPGQGLTHHYDNGLCCFWNTSAVTAVPGELSRQGPPKLDVTDVEPKQRFLHLKLVTNESYNVSHDTASLDAAQTGSRFLQRTRICMSAVLPQDNALSPKR
jgi:hypothetical protein